MWHRKRRRLSSFPAFNTPWDKKNEIMWEAFKIMKGAWDNPVFHYECKHFKCKDVQLGIPLVQKRYPPFWLPTRSPPSGLPSWSLNPTSACSTHPPGH